MMSMPKDDRDFWGVVFRPNISDDLTSVEWTIDSLVKFPIMRGKEIFWKGLSTDERNINPWKEAQEILSGMELRVRFNSDDMRGVYVFVTERDLFKDEKEFEDWFYTNPVECMKLIIDNSEVAGEGHSRLSR